jgi:hypothetical protein
VNFKPFYLQHAKGVVVLRLRGFAAVRMFPNRKPTLKKHGTLNSALKHQSVDMRGMSKAQCASAPKQAAGVFKVGVLQ